MIILGYLGEPVLPDPETVVVFGKTVLAGLPVGRQEPPPPDGTDLATRLAAYPSAS